MMANGERKLATSSLIPLEIDPASILSLSKGVIFDTIVHNIEYTLNKRRSEPLSWRLSGMSLICDPSRNKKFAQKRQKMQCVPSVICTQIYHSKLVKTESGILTTPGRKIIIPTVPPTRLTGIFICRSIDELLHMESSNTETVHFIQYKLLCYERIATRELVNGPKLSSVSDKIIKTVFDFELTQNNGFPRQLLPVAIISFSREDGFDLCSSIRKFLELDEHKIFDKSYLITSKNPEIDRLREEQERKEDAEAEQDLTWEKIHQRPPLADLSKKATDSGNARPTSIPQPSLRVPPLKIKLSRPEKIIKPSVSSLPLDSKFKCLLKLDKIDLSLYDISNISTMSQIKHKKLNESSTSLDSINNKTKSFTITKSYDHHKLLKRLNTSETKKQSSPSSNTSKEKKNYESMSIRSSTSDITLPFIKNKKASISLSSSTMSPIYRPNRTIQNRIVDKTITKNKVKRPVLPSQYNCSISLSRIDLSMYNLDLSSIATSKNIHPMDIESTITVSPSCSTLSEQPAESTNVIDELESNQDNIHSIFTMEQETTPELEEDSIGNTQQFDDINIDEVLPNILDEFLTPDINESLSITSNDVLLPSTNEILPQITNDSILPTTDDVSSISINEILTQLVNNVVAEATDEPLPAIINEILPAAIHKFLPSTTDEILLSVTNNVVSITTDEENTKSLSPNTCNAFSPELPPLDDDPVFFSIESPQIPITDISDTIPQGCIIIVPCSDDEDDISDEINYTKNSTINDTENKLIQPLSPLLEDNTSSTLFNPLSARILTNASCFNSHRLSTSSSCSSISTSVLPNQSPRSLLHLTEILIPKKILNKKQNKSSERINFNRFNLCIPLLAHEPLIDPRLIYRLQAITTDLRWPSPCNQCSISTHLPSLFTSSTQMISYDRKYSPNFIDPRRDSLKNVILNHIYQRINILIPNEFLINSNQFQKLLFEQTIFKTNCSLHLEYLLDKIKIIDDMNFFHMIKTNDEFQLSSSLLQLIFK